MDRKPHSRLGTSPWPLRHGGRPRPRACKRGPWSSQYITDWLTVRSDAPIVNHMVERSGQLDAVFHALAHAARRDMLRWLAGRELTVGELAEPLEMSLPAASKHLQVLERAGLVRRTVMGRRHVCRLDPGPLAGADKWLRFYERYWNEQLDALDRIFDGDSADDDTKGDR